MEDKPVRFGRKEWERVNGVDVCDHISLPNAYHPERGNAEYATVIQIHCGECEETFEIVELIN